MGKPFKETKVGKFLWGVGDALKGKGKAGKAAEIAGEILPGPNPVRVGKALSRNDKVEKMRRDPETMLALDKLGINAEDLLDDAPEWARTAFAFAALILFALGVYFDIIPVRALLEFLN